MNETFADRLEAFLANEKAVHGTTTDQIAAAFVRVAATFDDDTDAAEAPGEAA